jgi:NADH:ubiquinone oxidoreductase subunit
MADKKEKEERGKVTLVYAGTRVGHNNKLFQCFYKVNDDGTHEEEHRSYSKIKSLGRPGGVYEFDCDKNEESTIYPGSKRYVRHWAEEEDSPEENEVLQWQVQHDAANTADRARKREKKDTSRNLMRERLRPIRDAYIKSVGWERKAIVAEVVAYITGSTR